MTGEPSEFLLKAEDISLDSDLQIVQADIFLQIGEEQVIDEPLCVDVGLPSLVRSVLYDTEPDRWADVGEWEKVPFFVCGCGDPECRGYSFLVKHVSDHKIVWVEVEQQNGREYRHYNEWVISKSEYSRSVVAYAEQILAFVKKVDYRPLLSDTVQIVEQLIEQIRLQDTT